MDVAGWLIVAVVLLALVGLIALARRKAWNADGSDDRRRDRRLRDDTDADDEIRP